MKKYSQDEYDVVELLIKHRGEAITIISEAYKRFSSKKELKDIVLETLAIYASQCLPHLDISDTMCIIDRSFFERFYQLSFYLQEELYDDNSNSTTKKNTLH